MVPLEASGKINEGAALPQSHHTLLVLYNQLTKQLDGRDTCATPQHEQ